MIIGSLADVGKQKAVLPAAVVRAIEALQKIDLKKQEPGRYELEGDKLFYLVQDATPRSVEESKAEAHKSYADIQIPVSACERYGFSLPQVGLVPSEDKFEASDIAFYPSPVKEFFMDVEPGGFVVFLPDELHRPCVANANKAQFRKAVVKVHKSLLGL
jgi:biofilm protein TabA